MGIELDYAWIETPLRGLLGFRQLGDEMIECYVPIAGAGIWVVQGSIEGRRITLIPHANDSGVTTASIGLGSVTARSRAFSERGRRRSRG